MMIPDNLITKQFYIKANLSQVTVNINDWLTNSFS